MKSGTGKVWLYTSAGFFPWLEIGSVSWSQEHKQLYGSGSLRIPNILPSDNTRITVLPETSSESLYFLKLDPDLRDLSKIIHVKINVDCVIHMLTLIVLGGRGRGGGGYLHHLTQNLVKSACVRTIITLL